MIKHDAIFGGEQMAAFIQGCEINVVPRFELPFMQAKDAV
jgi:hypothetical protein